MSKLSIEFSSTLNNPTLSLANRLATEAREAILTTSAYRNANVGQIGKVKLELKFDRKVIIITNILTKKQATIKQAQIPKEYDQLVFACLAQEVTPKPSMSLGRKVLLTALSTTLLATMILGIGYASHLNLASCSAETNGEGPGGCTQPMSFSHWVDDSLDEYVRAPLALLFGVDATNYVS